MSDRAWPDFYRDQDFDLARLIRVSVLYAKYLDAIEEFAPGPKGLEVGTGTGWASVYLSHRGYRVTGIDRDSAIVAAAARLNRRFNGAAGFLPMDLFSLGFRAGEFDFAFHQGVLEHFDEPEIRAALREQLRVAKRVIFAVPGAKHKKRDFGDERLWTKKKWLEILAPFRVVRAFGFGYTNDPARLAGAAAHHPRYRRKRWAALLGRINDALFAGELGFVVEPGKGETSAAEEGS